ncbi:MAG TPA: RelA/SpoT domain-containing protein [Acidobacteriaceae bacterium]
MIRSPLLQSYNDNRQKADEFRRALSIQLETLIKRFSLSLATPIESRIKSWSSIVRKADRLHSDLIDVLDLTDFVGLRLVFLFSSEVARAQELINQYLDVIGHEDKGHHLEVGEFGYKSIHYDVRFKKTWCELPTFKDFDRFRAEIQVRTLSQHTWAVASRLLQYHQEAAVPAPIQRKMNILAAVLELVDSEMELIQSQKTSYALKAEKALQIDALDKLKLGTLDVDLLGAVLSHFLPDTHKIHDEPYGGLFHDLQVVGVLTVGQLLDLIAECLPHALENDAAALTEARRGNPLYIGDMEKISEGFFYSHVGLIRNMLNQRYGENWRRNLEGETNGVIEG